MGGIRYVEIGASDLDRSLDFYQDLLDLHPTDEPPPAPGVRWLAAGPVLLRLVDVGPGGLGGWVTDDLQRGIRHIGFKVGDVDRRAERVRDAGIPFTLPPMDAVGGVRIAFFQDPDGAHLEFIDKHLQYHQVFAADLAERERAAAARRPPDAAPDFDHVAVTVDDLDAALAFYRDALGYRLIGQIRQDQDPRGFVLTYLEAGGAVLEVFTFAAPRSGNPWTPDEPRLGIRHLGLGGTDRATLVAAGATPVMGELVTDRDGIPLRAVPG